MNESAVVFQYLLETLPDDWLISLKLDTHEIDFIQDRSVFLVTKRLTAKEFNIADPECGKKIADFLMEEEDNAIEMNFDMWYRVVSEKILVDIATRAKKLCDDFKAANSSHAPLPLSASKIAEKQRGWPHTKKFELELSQLYAELVDSSYHNKNLYNTDNSIWMEDDCYSWEELFHELDL